MGTRTYSRKGVLTAAGRRRAANQASQQAGIQIPAGWSLTEEGELVQGNNRFGLNNSGTTQWLDTPAGRIDGRAVDNYIDDNGVPNWQKLVDDFNNNRLPVAGAAPTAAAPIDPFTATDEDRTRFAVDSGAASVRKFTPEEFQNAWNGTSATELDNLLPSNDAATAITRALQLPTPREVFGRGGPERGTFSNRARKILSGALGGAGTGYSELRRSLGIDGFPAATDLVSRRASYAARTVGSLSVFVKKLPADLSPQVRAQVTALADAIGGLGLTKERIYETQILSKGSNTPKGRVLSRVVKQAQGEARRMANEINRLMGVSTRSSAGGLPAAGTPGREAYNRMMTQVSEQAQARNVKGRGPNLPPKMSLYTPAQLDALNND